MTKSKTPQKTKKVEDKEEEYKKCVHCDAYDQCNGGPCQYILDFIKFGKENYANLLQDCFKEEQSAILKRRIATTGKSFNGQWFAHKMHQERFECALYSSNLTLVQGKHSQIATLFLLTADNPLWQLVQKSAKYPSFITDHKDIEGVTTDQYALVQVANAVAKGEKYPDLLDLSNKTLVSPDVFVLILRGILLGKYGGELLTLNWEKRKDVAGVVV
ncbi:MAG: hypothetical protein R3Y63_12010 [Eubacteriales bacterium]